jgi:hypothetical protein
LKKKSQREHKFLETLLGRLQDLLKKLNTKDIRNDFEIKGALRAYFDTDLVESYEEPVIELNKLEMMLK